MALDTGVSPLRTVPPLHTAADRAVAADREIAGLDEAEQLARIDQLRRDRDAVILAHNYQVPAVQDVADFVGDSLQLAQQAAATTAAVIVFCGVHFMAETAAIISPDKRVLIPDLEASCSLAQSVTAEDVRRWRSEFPNAVVVAYVNTDAAVKAEADVCCTSSNAVAVVTAIPADREVLFLPDRFLGRYVERRTGRRMHLWDGACHVHAAITDDDIARDLARRPDGHVLVHPECGCVATTPSERTLFLSTGGMAAHVRSCTEPVDFVGTEIGMLHRLRVENPDKEYVPLRGDAVCSYMKTITVAKLYRALRDDVYEVRVPDDVAAAARLAITRMLASE